MRDEKAVNEIVFFRSCRLFSTTAPLLSPIVGQWLRLDITCMRQRDRDILGRDQVFKRNLLRIDFDLATARIGDLLSGLLPLLGNNRSDTRWYCEKVKQIGDRFHDLAILVFDLALLKPGQALQLHFENALCLYFGKTITLFVQSVFGRQTLWPGLHPSGAG